MPPKARKAPAKKQPAKKAPAKKAPAKKAPAKKSQPLQAGVKLADPAEIQEWSEDARDAHLECRIDNHRWKRRHIRRYPKAQVIEWWMRCTSCFKVKIITTTDPETHPSGRIRRIGTVKYQPLEGYDRKGKGRIAAEHKEIMRYALYTRQQASVEIMEED